MFNLGHMGHMVSTQLCFSSEAEITVSKQMAVAFSKKTLSIKAGGFGPTLISLLIPDLVSDVCDLGVSLSIRETLDKSFNPFRASVSASVK